MVIIDYTMTLKNPLICRFKKRLAPGLMPTMYSRRLPYKTPYIAIIQPLTAYVLYDTTQKTALPDVGQDGFVFMLCYDVC